MLYTDFSVITAKKKVIQTYSHYIDMHLYILIVFGFKHTNFRSHLFDVRTPCICMLLSAFFEQAQNIRCTTCYRKKGEQKNPKPNPTSKIDLHKEQNLFIWKSFSLIYIYLYIICENDTSKSYFHIYTFSFLEELHPSLDSFHTQDSWPRRPKQGGQRAHRAGNSEVQQQNALCGWESYQSLVSASQWFACIGLQIWLGISLLAWLFVCEPCRLPFQNQLLMPLEFDKKKEVMRTQVKLECQQAGKQIFYFIILEEFSYCTWPVCLLLCSRKEKTPT